jgi:hypothetical protein
VAGIGNRSASRTQGFKGLARKAEGHALDIVKLLWNLPISHIRAWLSHADENGTRLFDLALQLRCSGLLTWFIGRGQWFVDHDGVDGPMEVRESIEKTVNFKHLVETQIEKRNTKALNLLRDKLLPVKELVHIVQYYLVVRVG